MATDPSAKMFLANERGLAETALYRSYRTFNFNDFFHEHKAAFGDLYVWNDESLAGGHTIQMTVPEDAYVLLLPVVGAINYRDAHGNFIRLNAGEMQLVSLPALTHFELSNPYTQDLVNYLMFWIKGITIAGTSVPIVNQFDLVASKNQLLELMSSGIGNGTFLKCSIGQFAGREEAFYAVAPGSNLFMFVVEGAFEIAGRLLHPRDGLALSQVSEAVELEALSNEAIVIVVELGGGQGLVD